MKKQFIVLAITSFLLFFTMVAFALPFDGNGNVIKENRQVDKFTGIKIGSAFNVYLKQGKPQSVIVEIDENYMDKVKTTVSGNTLEVKTKDINNVTKMNLYITVENLSKIELSGASTFYFETPFDSGNQMEINISGAAGIKNADIKSNNMVIKSSGASNVNANINCSTLYIKSSGASGIILSGAASKRTIDTSGASSVDIEQVSGDETKISASGAASVNTSKTNIMDNNCNSKAASIKTAD